MKRLSPETAKIGLKVRLRSGGPIMTLGDKIVENGTIWNAFWFCSGELKIHGFHIDQLMESTRN